MTSSKHEAVNGLLAAAALDAVTDEEQLLVDTHVAECPDCRHHLAELAQTRDLLAASVVHVAPPASLRMSILAAAAADAAAAAPIEVEAPAAFPEAVPVASGSTLYGDALEPVSDLSRARAKRAGRFARGGGDNWFNRMAPGFALAGCAASIVLAVAVVSQRHDLSTMDHRLAASGAVTTTSGTGSESGSGSGGTTPVANTMFDGAHVSDVKLMKSTMAPKLHGQLVMKDGAGVLVLKGLPTAPSGKQWRAWRVGLDHGMTQYGVAGDGTALTVIPVGQVGPDNAQEVFLTLEPSSMPMSDTTPGSKPVAVATV